MSEKLLHKFLNSEITEAEMEILKASDVYREYLKIASHTSTMQTPSFNKERVRQNLSERTSIEKKKAIPLFNYRPFLKYAALIVLMLVGYFYLVTMDVSVTSQLAEKRTYTLPDKSEVTLNADSKITYNKNSWDDKRTLTLRGEAFFKVMKGGKFDVETSLGTVRVMGTQFNVQTREKHFHVSCYEGLVEVYFQNQSIQLTAGNSVIIENGKLIAEQPISTTKPGWMFDESTFENALLENVIEELERQYGVKVEINLTDKTKRFTGTFTHTNLEDALKTICVPLQLNYSIDDNRGIKIYEE
ncbi:MAG: FecR family protein [Flavobacteriales bacterium]|nr:FecR family protein [Flavobacteriales bacterium]